MTEVCNEVPPEIVEPRRYWSGIVVFLVIGVILGAGVLFLFNPAEKGIYPLCLFHASTGLLCPGCGSLRAMHQLLHGNLVAAMHYNALLVLCLPIGAWYGGRFAVAKWNREPFVFRVPSAALWSGLGVLLVFGILRNLPFAQALWLAP